MLLGQIRKQKKIKQKTLAEKLCCKVSTLSMWEHGYSNPPYTMVGKLAEALSVTEIDIIKCFNNGGKEKC